MRRVSPIFRAILPASPFSPTCRKCSTSGFFRAHLWAGVIIAGEALKENYYERTENGGSGPFGEAQGRGRDPRGLGCAGRGGAWASRAARPRRASALGLERYLPAGRRDPRGGAVRRLGGAAGALAHRGGRRRLRYRGGRGQKPDRRGRARDRQLPGLLVELADLISGRVASLADLLQRPPHLRR